MKPIQLLAATAAFFSVCAATMPAEATPYMVNYTIGSGSVTGTITTDGTVGALATANITGFSLLLNDGASTFNLTNSNGAVGVSGTSLTASTAGLFFNFSGTGTQYALFQAPTLGSAMNFFCVQTTGCFNIGGGAAVDVSSTFPGQTLAQTGVVQFGFTTAAVPEAATWAMMMVGIGATGAAMRRRRSVVSTRVRFA